MDFKKAKEHLLAIPINVINWSNYDSIFRELRIQTDEFLCKFESSFPYVMLNENASCSNKDVNSFRVFLSLLQIHNFPKVIRIRKS